MKLICPECQRIYNCTISYEEYEARIGLEMICDKCGVPLEVMEVE